MAENKHFICDHCNLPMEEQITHFSYLGHAFSTKLPACPCCGLVYIDEELVKGRMTEVERELEDK